MLTQAVIDISKMWEKTKALLSFVNVVGAQQLKDPTAC